jgi:hypothetical protein
MPALRRRTIHWSTSFHLQAGHRDLGDAIGDDQAGSALLVALGVRRPAGVLEVAPLVEQLGDDAAAALATGLAPEVGGDLLGVLLAASDGA